MLQLFADILLVIMLETAETTKMKQDNNNHNLSVTHAVGFVTVTGIFTVNQYLFPAAIQIPCKNHPPYNKFA